MAPGNDVEVLNSGDDGGAKLPWTKQMMLRITNGIKWLRIFIYNKEYQTFFGNSSSFWIKTAIYYCIFYVCLGLFYSGMIAVFGAIVSRESPTYSYHNNDMAFGGTVYPGMGFRPMSSIDNTDIIVYNSSEAQNDTVSSLTDYRRTFLTQYDTTYLAECSPTEPASELQPSQSCRFSWSDIVTSDTHPCAENRFYGWQTGQPCILIKLNKIYGWTPTPTTASVLNGVMNATGQSVRDVDARQDNIYITCNGKNPADKQAVGSMVYYSLLELRGLPTYGGIPSYFFPYMNSRDQVQPFVLVQFTALPMEQTIEIECRAWASNIEQVSEGTTRRGMVTFSIRRTAQAAPPKS